MKRFSVFVMLFCFITGCASSSPILWGRDLVEMRENLSLKEAESARKDEEIRRLKEIIAKKDQELRDKNALIEELKSKLKGFGVF